MIVAIKDYQFFKKLIQLPVIQEIWLFGSRARGDNQERADIDLAIYCPDASNNNWLTILDIIEAADTLLKIDCIRLDELTDISPIKNSIISQGIKVYERTQD
ncbi:Nucleotidyltransferase domain protein [Candidatus Trichorickettsia mobilis]|uniref:Nucleotidyltransferase domain protein n=1 Tax=Candidatus Trichorickettsia mobilis TaxID=1346319 RepID=A0ABZ0UUV5_9RICK|nr:nucleotidyltransferase domain-containing protein [Candidatus Trichorickettsia mobilis]WPY01396.1 Nucleotidyltransferase domain protein [Candidatus Trichorickettsia mobilis]